jgi:hypothetical protein
MSSRAELHAVMEADVSVLFVSESRDLPPPWDCAAVKGDFFTAFLYCPLPCHLERSCMPLWKRMVLFCFASESRNLPPPWDCAAVKGDFFTALFYTLPAAMSSRAELHVVMEADGSVLFVSEPRDLPCPWDCAAVKEDFFTAFFVLPTAMSSRAELHGVMEADGSVLFCL